MVMDPDPIRTRQMMKKRANQGENMNLKKKVYNVQIGLADDGEGNEVSNWMSKTVIATDAGEAIRRARIGKKEYPESVTLIAGIDVP